MNCSNLPDCLSHTEVKFSISDIQQARAYFPRGLEQPAGSFRFSSDALLLAKFGFDSLNKMPARDHFQFVDLGTGCGVVSFALLLEKRTGVRGWGIDREEVLIQAARTNCIKLGFSGKFKALQMDINDSVSLQRYIGQVDLVLANPPWRLYGSGREPVSLLRRRALFGGPETLLSFANAAYTVLVPGGRYVSIVGAERCTDQQKSLQTSGLCLVRTQLCGAEPGLPVRFALIEAEKPVTG